MNRWIIWLGVMMAVVYAIITPLPANEPTKKSQDALEKWYEDFSQSVSREFTNLGVTLQQLPNNISVGVGNWWEDTKQFQRDSWQQSQADLNRDWQTIKGWFNPPVETESTGQK